MMLDCALYRKKMGRVAIMFMDWHLFRRRALVMSLSAMGLVLIIWNIPQLEFVLYPFRLFVTFVHEAGHGLAAILTGGQFIRFEVMTNGSGLATTRGGLRSIIVPSGYLGASLFGTLLFYIVNRVPYPRIIAVVLSVGLILLSLVYGQTSRVALTVGVAFGLVVLLVGLFATRYMIVFLLNVLAIMTALNAVLDLFFLTQNTHARTPDGRALNDAAAFTQEIMPNTPPQLWAWIWAILSTLLLGTVIYRGVVRPLLQETLARRTLQETDIEAPPVYYEYAEGED